MYFAESADGLIAQESFPGESDLLAMQITIDSTDLMFEDAYSQLETTYFFESKRANKKIEKAAMKAAEQEPAKEPVESNPTSSAKDEPKKDGLIEKLKNAIRAILDKIRSILGRNKEHLTADDFMNSETGQVMVSEDFQKRCQEIDRNMAELKPFIARFAKWTDKDILEVEKICDRMDAAAHQWAPVAASFAKANAKARARGAVADATAKVINGCYPKLQENEELLNKQLMLNCDNPRKLKALKKAANTVAYQSSYMQSGITNYKSSGKAKRKELRGKFVKDTAMSAVDAAVPFQKARHAVSGVVRRK